MTIKEIIDAFMGGDIGDVEFTELMLEKGESIEKIGACLAEAREEGMS